MKTEINVMNILIITNTAIWLDAPIFSKTVQVYNTAVTKPLHFALRSATPDYDD